MFSVPENPCPKRERFGDKNASEVSIFGIEVINPIISLAFIIDRKDNKNQALCKVSNTYAQYPTDFLHKHTKKTCEFQEKENFEGTSFFHKNSIFEVTKLLY